MSKPKAGSYLTQKNRKFKKKYFGLKLVLWLMLLFWGVDTDFGCSVSRTRMRRTGSRTS